MSAVKVINKKQVLQQSNCNYEVTTTKEDDVKVPERNEFPLKDDEEKLLEIENQCSPLRKPEKIVKSESLKLRNIRLDLSSLKHSVIQKVNGNWTPIKNELSSDEFSEDDLSKKTEKKRKLRPVVPNYVTNTDRGPNRKPRQSKQEHLVLSSQTSPKLTTQVEQPLSIARRNARERYRVKQVNEGFTALRNKIPEYISKVYKEEKEKKKKNTKKLSKVETLRMAVDYIRHLETLLDLKSTEKDVWAEQAETETQPPCTTPPSPDNPTPVQVTYLDPPAPSYIVPIQYQPIIQCPDRVYYKYELPNDNPKETVTMEKRSTPTFMIATIIGNENQCVNEFNFYETLSRIKKEQSDDENEEDMEEEEHNEEDMDISPQKSDPHLSPKPTDVIIKVEKNEFTLPPIAETFTKTIPVFY